MDHQLKEPARIGQNSVMWSLQDSSLLLIDRTQLALPLHFMASSPCFGTITSSTAAVYSSANDIGRMGVSLLLIQIVANNWRQYGSIFGKNEIVRLMMSKDVILLGITDGASTVFCLGLQKLVVKGWIRWDREGWIIQHVCPATSDEAAFAQYSHSSRFGRRCILQASLALLDCGNGLGHTRSSSSSTALPCS